jgi:hypothetical protein
MKGTDTMSRALLLCVRAVARLGARTFRHAWTKRPRQPTSGFALEPLEHRVLLSVTPATPVEVAIVAPAVPTAPAPPAAVVTTDKADYAPGETALITTSNTSEEGPKFGEGEMVRFQVTRTDGIADAPMGNTPWYVVDGVGGFDAHQEYDATGQAVDRDADGTADWIRPDNDLTVNGSINTSWFVEDQYLGSSLRLTAAGQTSGAVATTDFTDALGTITLSSATASSPSQINIAWTNPTGGPDKIEIYRKLSTQPTFTLIATVDAKLPTTYNDTGLSANTSYDYEVRAMKSNNQTTEFSLFSTIRSATTLSATQATTTSVAFSGPSTYGASVSFVATVSASPAPNVGTVQFYLDGNSFGAAVGVTGGVATSASISTLAVGNHNVYAIYSETAGYSGSTSGLLHRP